MQNKRISEPAASAHVTAIASGQTWRGKKSHKLLDITGPDRRRRGRWIAVVHSAGTSASFSEDDIRDHYELHE